MRVWLVYKCTSDQYGTEALVGIYSTGSDALDASNIPGYQTRIKEVLVHPEKEAFASRWVDVNQLKVFSG